MLMSHSVCPQQYPTTELNTGAYTLHHRGSFLEYHRSPGCTPSTTTRSPMIGLEETRLNPSHQLLIHSCTTTSPSTHPHHQVLHRSQWITPPTFNLRVGLPHSSFWTQDATAPHQNLHLNPHSAQSPAMLLLSPHPHPRPGSASATAAPHLTITRTV